MTILQLLSVLFFVLMCYGLGAGLKTLFKLKNQTPMMEVALRFLLGLGVFSIISFALDTIRVPLHWSLFLVISLAGIAYSVWYDTLHKSHPFALPKSFGDIDWGIIAVLLMVIALSFVMIKGANMYPYLEDDDPWQHAEGTLYVAEKLTARQTPGDLFTHYLSPYPPAFDALLGVQAQISHDVPWTLKFFNGLLLGIMLLPAYLFYFLITKSKIAAAVMTAILMVLPAFAGHFIWSQTYALVALFIAMAATILAVEDKKWFWPAIIMLGSSLIIQPSATVMNGIIFAVVFVAYCIHALVAKKKLLTDVVKRLFMIGVLGLAIAIVFYAVLIAMYGNDFLVVNGISLDPSAGAQGFGIGDTSGGVIYSFKDFWEAPMSSKIDQATGLGWFIMTLCILGLAIFILKFNELKKKEWAWSAVLLFVVGMIYMQGNRFPHHLLYVHRFWPWLSIGVAMIAGLTILVLLNSVKMIPVKVLVLTIVGVLLLVTAGHAKYTVQTAGWPPGVHWNTGEELAGYINMSVTLPKNSAVFAACKDDRAVIGFGMYSPVWEKSVRDFRKTALNASSEEVVAFLREHKYKFMIVDTGCVLNHGLNETQNFLGRVSETQLFMPVAQQNGFVLVQFVG